ncbi:MAG: CaiB/BaiF CoA-transferase family protein [Paenibacillaceae bacterium]
MAGALEGIRVLDLSRVLAGPYCSMILGDLGAEIIKVEGPQAQDDTRYWGPPYQNNESAYYLCANRNKRAISLNLKSSRGKEAVKKLIQQSDVVIQNFKTETSEKMGLDYNTLKQHNPKIIVANITGFGLNGPYKNLPGYDYIIQAMGGLMSITGDESSGPMKVGVAIADVLTGLYTAIGILSALHERNQSNVGQHLDISLFDVQVSSLVNVASNYLISGEIPQRLGNQHPNIVPYQVFHTQDQDIVVAVGNDNQFVRFTNVIGMPQLAADVKYRLNSDRLHRKDELIGIISAKMKQKPASEWKILLQDAGIPNGPINNMEDLFNDPQIKERDMLIEMSHPTADTIRMVGSPIKLSKTPVSMRRHPPLFSEHTEEVLLELGYSQEEIKVMQSEGDI